MKFVGPTYGPLTEEAEIVMRISRDTVEGAGHEWLHIAGEAQVSPHAAAIAKDLLVLELAAMPEYADAVFLDWDIELRRLWEMIAGRPYFLFDRGIDGDREWVEPKISMFAVNGCTPFFVALQEERRVRGHRDNFGFPRKVLHDKTKLVYEIPADCYKHHRLTSGNPKQ